MTQDIWEKSGLDPAKAHLLAGLRQPDTLLIPIGSAEPEQTAVAFGCDQDWYEEAWKRQAGCGPCTSATLLLYLARSHVQLQALYPLDPLNQASFTRFMDKIWHYVTPGYMGVNEAAMLVNGIVRYAETQAIRLDAQIFPISGQMNRRKHLKAFVAFLSAGLQLDSPIAFLNLSNGRLDNLDSWHWITLTRLYQYGDHAILAEASDSGERKLINLSVWYASSRLGGAAVYFLPAAPPG